MAISCLIASKGFADLGGYRIAGSKHDFKNGIYQHSGQNMVSTSDCAKCHTPHSGQMLPTNLCTMCHVAHRPKRVTPLWGRPDPSSAGWIVWNGSTGQLLDGTQGASYLTAQEFVASGSGLCLSCHDSGVAGALQDMSSHHPLGKVIPFGTPGFQTSLNAGNLAAGSNVAPETRGTVGCTSCHSIHSGDPADNKLRRPGDLCLACHDH